MPPCRVIYLRRGDRPEGGIPEEQGCPPNVCCAAWLPTWMYSSSVASCSLQLHTHCAFGCAAARATTVGAEPPSTRTSPDTRHANSMSSNCLPSPHQLAGPAAGVHADQPRSRRARGSATCTSI
eukprot:364849-Chlamydomonas_euryale.AAC.3